MLKSVRLLSPAHFFQRMLIRNKIIAIYVPLILIPLLILGVMSSNLFTRSLIKHTERNVLDKSNLILSRFESIIGSTESCANILMLALNPILTSFPKDPGAYEEIQLKSLIQSQFSINKVFFPDVDSIVFIDDRNHIYTSYLSANSKDAAVFTSGMMEQLQKAENYGGIYWLPMERRDYLVTDPSVPVLTLAKKMIDINTGELLGILLLNIKENTFSNVYQSSSTGSAGSLYRILDDRKLVISASAKNQLLMPLEDPKLENLIQSPSSASHIILTDRQKYLVTSLSFKTMDWKLVNMVPLRELTGDMEQNVLLTVIIGLICLVIALVGTSFFSRMIVDPLQKLAHSMRKVKDGNLDVTCTIRSADEIGLLSSVFNSMIMRIKDLLERVETEQRRKKEYELALIHAQIKPHFLYNTLDLIYVLSDMNRVQEARDTTKALADFYRVALNKGKEIITIREEIRNAVQYLSIQHVRYSDVFDFEVNMPNDILDNEIPKLSIQPIIENAIYHGLRTKGTLGHIRIDGTREANLILIRIIDDGVGMSLDKIKEIMRFQADNLEPVSFGVFSVHERIKLYYGVAFGIAIHSKEGQGTEVCITLPADFSRRKL